jgi:hypothetical protein
LALRISPADSRSAKASLTPAKRLNFMVVLREYLENFNEDIG